MKNKIIGILMCMLMITTVIPIVGAVNVQTPNTLASGLIGIKIVAQVYSVDDPYNLLGGVIEINDMITGKYVYDTGIPDTNPNPSHGVYQFTSSSCKFEVTAGGLSFKTNPSDVHLTIDILNDYITIGDQYAVMSSNNLQLSNGMLVNVIQWDLLDTNGSALDSDVLPTTVPILDDWPTNNQLSLVGQDPSNPTKTYLIYAHVTSATKNILVVTQEAKTTIATPLSPLPNAGNPSLLQLRTCILERFPNSFPILRHILGY